MSRYINSELNILKFFVFLLLFNGVQGFCTDKITNKKIPADYRLKWKINEAVYHLSFEEKELLYKEDIDTLKLVVSSCSKPWIFEFKNKIQNNLNEYSYKIPFPTNYHPIQVTQSHLGTFSVARGSNLGLFFIDMKFEMLRLKGIVEFQCR